MEKVICLLWSETDADMAAFNARLLGELPQALAAAGAQRLRINLEDSTSKRGEHLRQSRGERQHDSLIQFWLPSANSLFRASIDAALDEMAARWAGWAVTESTAIPNTLHPPVAGTRTAGWSQTAFLIQPERLTRAAWLDHWQNWHTRVAIETQANFEYVQNLIAYPLKVGAPPYAAIVEECFPEAALTDPLAFFDAAGDPARFKINLDRMMDSCDRFIDRGAIDVIPTGQYTF